ncbi:S1/P1 nuclease [Mycena sp. CBHHK59/15]|nr:S1/P1 nuclease [Mycena sp. CBHHK59/15]
MKTLAHFGILSTFLCGVYGWGATGHEAVGYIAMQFLSPKALASVQSSLGATYSETLGVAAPISFHLSWADTVRSEAAYSWYSVYSCNNVHVFLFRSAPFHFVDAEDNPPTSCSVSKTRDCGSGNYILTAIANYTNRVVETSLAAMQRQEALKFLDHFLGDVTQPLHVEALEVGGNDIDATCTNLHAVNSGMINKLLPANYSDSVTTWANALAKRIKTGTFNGVDVSTWISCSSTTTPAKRSTIEDDISSLIEGGLESRAVTPLACPLAWVACPLAWAQDANKFDCSFVFNFKTGTDLCTSSYYTNVVPLIETQIAKSGYRLAAWLNVLFDGATNLP